MNYHQKVMRDADERRTIITTYYKNGKIRGLWLGFWGGFLFATVFWSIVTHWVK